MTLQQRNPLWEGEDGSRSPAAQGDWSDSCPWGHSQGCPFTAPALHQAPLFIHAHFHACLRKLDSHKIKWRRCVPAQITPASSLWKQSCVPSPLWEHCSREDSFPVHFMLSRRISPVPSPKKALILAERASPQPISLHTTLAFLISQSSSQTVPHHPL